MRAEGEIAEAVAGPKATWQRSLWQDAARRYFKNKLAIFGLIVAGSLIATAILADIVAPAPYDYSDLAEALQFPSLKHPLGTDPIGRDFLSRIIYGARTSIAVGLAVQGIALLIGVPLGILAGLLGGKVDYVVTRLVEVMTAFPGLLFSIFIMTIMGNGFFNVILAIGLTGWVGVCRLMRAQAFSIREKEFVVAARAMGARTFHVILRHILPNALGPLLVMVTLGIPGAMFAEAGLSFLGLGINDPLPSWGKMVSESTSYIRIYWHLGLFPTLMIALSMLSFTFVGDGLRDALDPTMKQ
jgi:ABC-type dipeptide/oligopeptide/nickel transport system permease subunit